MLDEEKYEEELFEEPVEEEIEEERVDEEEEKPQQKPQPAKKRVFVWEVIQFLSSNSVLAIKPVYNPNERKLSKRFGVIFQLKNKERDKDEWAETKLISRSNEVAKIYEFLNLTEKKKSTYYYDISDPKEVKSLLRLFGGSKLVESIVTDKRNFPTALVSVHRYTDRDGNDVMKGVLFVKGTEVRKDKYRGDLEADFIKIVVYDSKQKRIFLKKLSDMEVENFKIQLKNIVEMTTEIPLIAKLDYIISLLRPQQEKKA